MKKWLWIMLFALVAGIAWKALYTPPPLELKVVEVERGEVELTVSNTRAGTIKACRRSGLSMPAGGRVDILHVTEGDQVKAGDLLLELWNEDRKAMTAQARSQLKAAQHRRQQRCVEADNAAREAQRLQQLLERKLASRELTEAAGTRAQSSVFACQASQDEQEMAASQLLMNEALLAQTKLRAPFDGVVAEITGEIGEYVTPSPPGVATPPAVDLIDYSCLYVTAPIDEVDAGKIQVGQTARISLDAFRGQFFEGRLNRIAPYVLEIEKQARTVEVDVLFEHPEDRERLLVGYSADIDLILENHTDTLRIPSETLLEDNSVYRLNTDAGLVERVTVQTGLKNWDYTEILGGLAVGDKLVISLDVAGLADGAAAIIKE